MHNEFVNGTMWFVMVESGSKVMQSGGVMFLGENHHSLDAKGRLIVPAKLREKLGPIFVVTKGIGDKYICIYPISTWNAIAEKLKGIPSADKDGVRFQRFLIGSAHECEPDAQGRVLIPLILREYAGIVKEVVSVGMTDRIEIWAKEEWSLREEDLTAIDDALLEKMSERGI